MHKKQIPKILVRTYSVIDSGVVWGFEGADLQERNEMESLEVAKKGGEVEVAKRNLPFSFSFRRTYYCRHLRRSFWLVAMVGLYTATFDDKEILITATPTKSSRRKVFPDINNLSRDKSNHHRHHDEKTKEKNIVGICVA